jgi:hypothetical protein
VHTQIGRAGLVLEIVGDDMASRTRRSVHRGHGGRRRCGIAIALALASLASPRRHVAAAAAAVGGSGPKWHVVSVSSLLPSTVCTAAEGSTHLALFVFHSLTNFFTTSVVVLRTLAYISSLGFGPWSASYVMDTLMWVFFCILVV